MESVIRVAIRRPRTVIAVWLVLAALCTPLMMGLTGALKAGGFENPRGEDRKGQQALERDFHEPEETLQAVLHDPDGEVTRAVPEAARLAEGSPKVTSVQDYRQQSAWLSKDRHTTFLQLGFDADATTVQGEIDGLRERLDAALGERGVSVKVTGEQALDYDMSVQSEKDTVTAELIAFPLLIIVLLLVFRSVGSMLVPIVLAGVALVVAMAAGTLLAQVTDLSVLFMNAVTIIGLAVSVDYCLFIIKRYRDELADSAEPQAALETAMRTAGHAVRFSGLAVVVALLALLIPRMMVFTSIALAGIVVTLIALAISMTLLPAVLRLLGPRINWASLKPRRARAAKDAPGPLARLHRRPLPLLLISVVVFTALSLPILNVRLQAPVASASILPEDAESRQGIERLQKDLDSQDLFPLQAVLTAPRGTSPGELLAAVDKAAKRAEGLAGAGSVRAVTTLGLPRTAQEAAAAGRFAGLPREARAAFEGLWSHQDGRYVSRVVVVAKDEPDSDGAHDLVRDLRDALPGAEVVPGLDTKVTGATAHGVDFDDALIGALPAILGAVALITLALLTRAFRSWRLPLLALVLNAMVVGAGLGLLTLISQGALGQRIDSTTPVLLFAIMFGLSMDYMVIMIARMRERYLLVPDHRSAVTEGMRNTAGLVNGAAVIMVAVFVSFLAAKISVVQQLGLGLALAVVLDALVIRLLVMPAALNLLGPRVWGRVPAASSAPSGGPAPEPRPPSNPANPSEEVKL
ncbi:MULTISPECIES: MMPL family transporter [unclassified Streptomyces]|uniref:MMPL family transporter n=1 Tax=unclassified Streptomyces TaxID=2593676 RepID=UPI002DDA37D1|nr:MULTISPECIES: MMPL family transporter [unclassified Streptomyces]WSA95487.1 MMPL family transporter [Streptomyces sp. NBC_01795]WSB79903.1 MMPL family transporter [Streptomyces sp. NBC_01775]WSS11890.1 MMPL family transporter [Streptomyces sp. NBC_01186]WSS40604.1 MMPL family transporter [Streptomyces sp. NBC_01187]